MIGLKIRLIIFF